MARARPTSVAVSVAVVLVLVTVTGWYFHARDRGLPLVRRPVTVLTLGISLVPDATGTVVEVVGESADGSLPARLDLDLKRSDDAALVEGGPSTGEQLRYSDVVDGLGNRLPADQVRAAQLRDVGTDGRRLRLTFHIAAVNGRRIVYPIPLSPEVGWVRARLYVPSGTVRCWGDAPAGNSAFGRCASPAANEIDGRRHAGVRLELTTRTAPSSA